MLKNALYNHVGFCLSFFSLVCRRELIGGRNLVRFSRFELVPLQGFCGNRFAISVIILNGCQISWL